MAIRDLDSEALEDILGSISSKLDFIIENGLADLNTQLAKIPARKPQSPQSNVDVACDNEQGKAGGTSISQNQNGSGESVLLDQSSTGNVKLRSFEINAQQDNRTSEESLEDMLKRSFDAIFGSVAERSKCENVDADDSDEWSS